MSLDFIYGMVCAFAVSLYIHRRATAKTVQAPKQEEEPAAEEKAKKEVQWNLLIHLKLLWLLLLTSMESLDTLEITLAVTAYLAISLGVMRYSYPRLKSRYSSYREIDSDAVFGSVFVGLFFPLAFVVIPAYYILKGFVWLITYQNNE